jgi:CubicO group peptidase (beta-lactamase class C family)
VGLSVKKGLLAWDVPVSKYVPNLAFNDATIQDNATLADFLSMRTGLDGTEEWQTSPEKTSEAVKSIVNRLQPEKEFRRDFLYSGFSINVAAMVLESVSGRHWTEILEEDFRATGMEAYGFSYAQAQRKDAAAHGYQWSDGVFARHPWPDGEEELVDPAGTLCLSAKDLLCGLRSIEAAAEGTPSFHPHILTRFPDVPLDYWPESYGLCWGLRTYRGHQMIYHRGSDWGFRSVVAMVPEAGLKIVIVSNRHRSLLIHLLLNHLLDEILGHSYIPWEPLFETYAKQTNQGR